MAQDPAFLFYSSDFLTGTHLFSHEQRGQYITLLCIQHQQGHIPEKHMLFICGTYDNDVIKKFTKDEAGFYYNERLEKEVNKRKIYSESRRSNRVGNPLKPKPVKGKKICKSYVPHMENENEIIKCIVIPNNSERISKIWDVWIEYKFKQHKFKYADIKYEQIGLNQLVKLGEGSEDKIEAIVNYTISNAYQGFIAPKNTRSSTKELNF